ncbi:MAG TPA: NTP transferase domain-containing protein [Actinomadura sp.]|jgi:molybdopterin-guanine dinucleotide biosynthesis protein A|nr:NTP transferase domain-containing protein [Actinomadura sp.]
MTGDAYDAVILGGGLARRLGGADKPGMLVGGRSLIGWVADAAAGANRLVIVGPPRADVPHAITARENPPGSGPVPALRAGLAEVRAPWLVLLAADLPFLRPGHVTELVEAARAHGSGAVLVDADGREQWLVGAWRTAALTAGLGGYRGRSLGGLLGGLCPVTLRTGGGSRPPWYDCDTPEDLAAAADLES